MEMQEVNCTTITVPFYWDLQTAGAGCSGVSLLAFEQLAPVVLTVRLRVNLIWSLFVSLPRAL